MSPAQLGLKKVKMVGLAASSVGVVIGCLMGMSCLFFMDVGKNERRGNLHTGPSPAHLRTGARFEGVGAVWCPVASISILKTVPGFPPWLTR